MKGLVLALLVLFALRISASGGPAWEFETAGDTEGWTPLNDITGMTVSDGALQLELEGIDPYFWLGDLELDASEYAGLMVRLKTDEATPMQLYWVTRESPEWFGPDSKRLNQPVKGDNRWHNYVFRLYEHRGWGGTVTGLRLDPAEAFPNVALPKRCSIDYIRLLTPEELCGWRVDVSKPVATAGEVFTLYTRLFSDSPAPLGQVEVELKLPEGLELWGQASKQTSQPVALGAPMVLEWKLVATAAGAYPLEILATSSSGEVKSTRRVVHAVGDWPKLPRPEGEAARLAEGKQGLVLYNNRVALAFAKTPYGYGPFRLYGREVGTGNWTLLAAGGSLSRLVSGEDFDEQVFASGWQRRKAGLDFETSLKTGDGERWRFSFSFTLEPDSDLVAFDYRATPDQAALLRRFDGPFLRVGEGTFGTRKRGAVCCGLEYLEADQESSSRKDFSNQWRWRMTPHPYRIASPVMSVTAGDHTVGVLWNALHEWAPGELCPGAAFASPNTIVDCGTWSEYGQHHLMGLFAPSVPDYVPEAGEVATEPYPVAAGQTLRLQGHLLAGASTDTLYGLERWIEVYGLPEPAGSPRSKLEQRTLYEQAWCETFWNEEAGGWSHWIEEPTYAPSPWLELLVRLLAEEEPLNAARAELLARADLSAQGKATGPSHNDTTGLITAYFLGRLTPESFAQLQRVATSLKASQEADGSWRYQVLPLPKGFEDSEPLGYAGMPSVYETASDARYMLRWANLSGEEEALALGLKALDWLTRLGPRVPQGAPFECPAASPYLLTSAYAVDAFLEGYTATRDPALLEGARYWARTGLPFIYFWNLPDTPVQRYATCGVMGSSYGDIANWIGRPVQWIGLLYAYSLARLAQLDAGFDWAQVAEGILVSAYHQQALDEERAGAYPDSLDGAGDILRAGFKDGYPTWIQPEYLYMPELALEGRTPELELLPVAAGGRTLRLASSASLKKVRYEEREQRLTCLLEPFFTTLALTTTVAGGSKPISVKLAGRRLAEQPAAPGGEGWWWDEPSGLLAITSWLASKPVKLEIAY